MTVLQCADLARLRQPRARGAAEAEADRRRQARHHRRHLLVPCSRTGGAASTCGIACSEAIDRDRSRKRAIVEVPMVLDGCRSMVEAAFADPSQSDGKDDGKTHAFRDKHQARQRLTEAVDDRVGVRGRGSKSRRMCGQRSGQIQERSGSSWPNPSHRPATWRFPGVHHGRQGL